VRALGQDVMVNEALTPWKDVRLVYVLRRLRHAGQRRQCRLVARGAARSNATSSFRINGLENSKRIERRKRF
jgi:hypothetical protein